MCVLCKSNQYENATKTHTVTIDNNVIVVLNVPCTRCVCCGETFYCDDVVIKLEKIIDKAKEMLSSVNVLDFQKIA